jgi:hypothetical protein
VLRRPNLNPERAAEPPATVVRLRAVVIKEDAAEATITKERAAEFSDKSIRAIHHKPRKEKQAKFFMLSPKILLPSAGLLVWKKTECENQLIFTVKNVLFDILPVSTHWKDTKAFHMSDSVTMF